MVVQNEDEKAKFARLVVPHLSDAMTIARWLTRNRSDAEDVLQESCLRAFRSISQLREGNARSWILAIVRNTAYTWLRKNRSESLVLVEDLTEDERSDAELGGELANASDENPETQLIERVDVARLEIAIEGLPPQFREVLVLRDIQGLDYREIAQLIGAPVGTVMSRLARARERLIQIIRAEQP
jgi:RNA polymerase sigma-70 factor (ECF subfamily)